MLSRLLLVHRKLLSSNAGDCRLIPTPQYHVVALVAAAFNDGIDPSSAPRAFGRPITQSKGYPSDDYGIMLSGILRVFGDRFIEVVHDPYWVVPGLSSVEY